MNSSCYRTKTRTLELFGKVIFKFTENYSKSEENEVLFEEILDDNYYDAEFNIDE